MRHRRRPLLSALALVVLFASAPAGATRPTADSGEPVLVGVNEFTAAQSRAFPVRLTRALRIRPSDNGMTLHSARWAAFFLVRQPEVHVRPSDPIMFGQVQLPPPAGCAAGLPPAKGCADRRGLVLSTIIGGRTSGSRLHTVVDFPPGRYVAYVLTPTGVPVRAALKIPGVGGRTAVAGGRQVRVSMSTAVSRQEPAAARIRQTVSQSLRRHGVLFERTWAAATPGTQYELDSQHVCVTRGDTGSAGPVSGADQCWLMDGVLPLRTMTSRQPGATGGVLVSSSTYGLSTTGIDITGVAPGTYTVDAAASIVGDRPRAGTALLAFEYLF